MEKEMVNLTIDNQKITVPKGTTILNAAKKAGIDIPTLCFLKEINEVGDCRMCIVEVEGRKGFATSCIQKVEEGMVVVNSTGLIGKIIRTTTFTSEVRLITTSDTNNKISVSISNGNNKVNGLINGYDYENNLLEVEGISNTEEVNVGDYVYTSGLGGVFPSGILIGTVESITTDEYDLAKIINVKPSADFNDINYVAILKRKDIEK